MLKFSKVYYFISEEKLYFYSQKEILLSSEKNKSIFSKYHLAFESRGNKATQYGVIMLQKEYYGYRSKNLGVCFFICIECIEFGCIVWVSVSLPFEQAVLYGVHCTNTQWLQGVEGTVINGFSVNAFPWLRAHQLLPAKWCHKPTKIKGPGHLCRPEIIPLCMVERLPCLPPHSLAGRGEKSCFCFPLQNTKIRQGRLCQRYFHAFMLIPSLMTGKSHGEGWSKGKGR